MTKKTLVIAEKPSVARTIADVAGAYKNGDGYLEGGDTIVSWCYGHLAEFAPPEAYSPEYARWRLEDLPIVPAHWKLAVARDGQAQFGVLEKLLHRDDVGCAVNACDAGREGELIFWNVYELAGCSLPVKRLWTSSLEKEAVREALGRMKDAEAYRGLRQAAVCRAKADWLVGINATRAFSAAYGRKLLAGRVQSPVLAMLARRQEETEGFESRPYYRIALGLAEGVVAVSDDIPAEADADALAEGCRHQPVFIEGITRTMARKNPPKLYDLTSLQREANRLYGYTAKETLDALQELYEEKLVTYPRTDSRWLTSDMAGTAARILDGLAAAHPCLALGGEKDIQAVIRDIVLRVDMIDIIFRLVHQILPWDLPARIHAASFL